MVYSYEQTDDNPETYTKKSGNTQLAGAYEDKEAKLPLRPETASGAPLQPAQDAAKSAAQEWWYTQQFIKRMQGKK